MARSIPFTQTVQMFALCGLLVGCVATVMEPTPSDTSQTRVVAPFTAGNKTPYEVFGVTYEVMPDSFGHVEIGVASWYGKKFHGRLTSNGEKYDMYGLSAAHKSLPIPSMVKVTNLDNGKSINLRINDRGPFHDNRIIDLSYAAAKAIGFDRQGTAPVVVEALDQLNHPDRYAATEHSQQARFYLQLGAFSELRWADALKQRVTKLFETSDQPIQLKILETEVPNGLLHKVWLGPMATAEQRADIAARLEAANLGKPINVEVD